MRLKPGCHLQQTERPQHQKQSDYVVEQSSIALIALFWLEIGLRCGRNWLYGNFRSKALAKLQRNITFICFCLDEAKRLCLRHCYRLLDGVE